MPKTDHGSRAHGVVQRAPSQDNRVTHFNSAAPNRNTFVSSLPRGRTALPPNDGAQVGVVLGVTSEDAKVRRDDMGGRTEVVPGEEAITTSGAEVVTTPV